MTIKLKIIQSIELGILDIYNRNNEEIDELVFENLYPLSWTVSTVFVPWLKLTESEKEIDIFIEQYQNQIRDKSDELILIEQTLVNINDGQYKISFKNYQSYNIIFNEN